MVDEHNFEIVNIYIKSLSSSYAEVGIFKSKVKVIRQIQMEQMLQLGSATRAVGCSCSKCASIISTLTH